MIVILPRLVLGLLLRFDKMGHSQGVMVFTQVVIGISAKPIYWSVFTRVDLVIGIVSKVGKTVLWHFSSTVQKSLVSFRPNCQTKCKQEYHFFPV